MADKTTGELRTVKIGDLTSAPDIYDDFKMPGELQGEAVHITGSQIKYYAVAAGVQASEVFTASVKTAATAATAAKEAASASAQAASASAGAASASAQKASASAENAAASAEKALIIQNAKNLLDNTDFTNPVNQRRQFVYPSGVAGYTIDRWRTSAGLQLEVMSDRIRLTNSTSSLYGFIQYLPEGRALKPGDVVTIVCETIEGMGSLAQSVIHSGAVTVPESGYTSGPYLKSNTVRARVYAPSDTMPYGGAVVMLAADATIDIKWIALYEGGYTRSTLPPYQPKGYAAELAECQRYFRVLNSLAVRQKVFLMDGYAESETTAVATLDLPIAMRALPTVSWTWQPSTPLEMLEASDEILYAGQANVQSITAREDTSDLDRLRLDITLENKTVNGVTFSFKRGNRYEFFFDTEGLANPEVGRLYLDANL